MPTENQEFRAEPLISEYSEAELELSTREQRLSYIDQHIERLHVHHTLLDLLQSYFRANRQPRRHHLFAFGNNLYKTINGVLLSLIVYRRSQHRSTDALFYSIIANEVLGLILSLSATFNLEHRRERIMGLVSSLSTLIQLLCTVGSAALVLADEHNELASELTLFAGLIQGVLVSAWRPGYAGISINTLRHQARELMPNRDIDEVGKEIQKKMREADRLEDLYMYNIFRRMGNIIIEAIFDCSILLGLLYPNAYLLIAIGAVFTGMVFGRAFHGGVNYAGSIYLDRLDEQTPPPLPAPQASGGLEIIGHSSTQDNALHAPGALGIFGNSDTHESDVTFSVDMPNGDASQASPDLSERIQFS